MALERLRSQILTIAEDKEVCALLDVRLGVCPAELLSEIALIAVELSSDLLSQVLKTK